MTVVIFFLNVLPKDDTYQYAHPLLSKVSESFITFSATQVISAHGTRFNGIPNSRSKDFMIATTHTCGSSLSVTRNPSWAFREWLSS